MPKDKDIEPIDASLDDVANSLINPAPNSDMKNNKLEYEFETFPAPSTQLVLDLHVQVHINH